MPKNGCIPHFLPHLQFFFFMANMDKSVIVYDGTSHFVESWTYVCERGEVVVFWGSFERCSERSDELNDECKKKRRR